MASTKWSDMSATQQRAVVALGVVEVVVTLAAIRDLARRPGAEVRGSKAAWGLALSIQPVGPIAYFVLGRR